MNIINNVTTFVEEAVIFSKKNNVDKHKLLKLVKIILSTVSEGLHKTDDIIEWDFPENSEVSKCLQINTFFNSKQIKIISRDSAILNLNKKIYDKMTDNKVKVTENRINFNNY